MAGLAGTRVLVPVSLRGDHASLFKGEVVGRTACAFFPAEKESTIAFYRAGLRRDIEGGKGGFDPAGFPFELCPGADGRFIQDEVAWRYVFGCRRVPLRPKLFIAEGRAVPELAKDLCRGRAVFHVRFGLDASFIPTVDGVRFGHPLVRHHETAAVFPNAQDLPLAAQCTVRGVEERIALKGARRFELKSEALHRGTERGNILNGKLQFGFRRLHIRQYRTGARLF